MTIFKSPRVVAIAGAGLLAVTLLGGAALAQDEPDGSSESSHSVLAGCHHLLPYLGLRAIVEASGLELEVFRTGFEEDKTINAILEENGLDPATVKQDVLDNLQAKLDEAVASGRITEEEAAALMERASGRLDTLMSSAPDGLPRGHGRNLLGSAAEVIGIDTTDLAQALRDGQTVAKVAGENGVDPQTVIDALVAEANARIDEKAAEEGWDEERVTELKENALEYLTTFVNEGGPLHDRPRIDSDGAGFRGGGVFRGGVF